MPAFQQRYEAVLSALRRPRASGLLVLSYRPAGGARKYRRDLRPGEIIFLANEHHVKDVPAMRAALHEGPANLTAVMASGHVVHFRLPNAGALRGAWLRPVAAGVPLPLNPLPTPRRLFRLHWWPRGGNLSSRRRVTFWQWRWDGAAIEDEKFKMLGAGHRLTLHITLLRLTQPPKALVETDSAPARPAHWTVRLAVTSNRDAAGFVLTKLTRRTGNRRFTLHRTGNHLLRTTGRTPKQGPHPYIPRGFPATAGFITVDNILPRLALPALAAALPHRAGIVFPLAILGTRHLNTHAGYVLQTLGRHERVIGGVATRLWTIRLLRYGAPRGDFYVRHYHLIAARPAHGPAAIGINRWAWKAARKAQHEQPAGHGN